MNKTERPIAVAARCVGNSSRLAEILGVTKSAVWLWENRTRVPAERCPDIERATNGAVRCEDLRPDVDWSVLRNSASS